MSAGQANDVLVLGGENAALLAKIREVEAALARMEKRVTQTGGSFNRAGAVMGQQMAAAGKASSDMGKRSAFGFLEAARGFEDFSSQMHLGAGPALRASMNNISQLAVMMGGPLVGAIATVAAVTGAVFIPKLFASSEEAKDAAKNIKAVEDRLQDVRKVIAKFTGTEGALKEQAEQVADKEAVTKARSVVETAKANFEAARDKAKLTPQLPTFGHMQMGQGRSSVAAASAAKEAKELADAERLLQDAIKTGETRRFVSAVERERKRMDPAIKNLKKVWEPKEREAGVFEQKAIKESKAAAATLDALKLEELEKKEGGKGRTKEQIEKDKVAAQVRQERADITVKQESEKRTKEFEEIQAQTKFLEGIYNAVVPAGRAANTAAQVIPTLNRAAGL